MFLAYFYKKYKSIFRENIDNGEENQVLPDTVEENQVLPDAEEHDSEQQQLLEHIGDCDSVTLRTEETLNNS